MPIEPTAQQLQEALAEATGTNTAPATGANEAADALDPMPMPPVVGGINLSAETPQQLASLIGVAREFGLSDNDAAKLAAEGPGGAPLTVTQAVRDQYSALKERLMKDKGFVAEYLDGDQKAQAIMMETNLRLIVPVRG